MSYIQNDKCFNVWEVTWKFTKLNCRFSKNKLYCFFSGITGNKIQLCANYFPITSYTNWNLYQYSVEFNPEQEKRVVQRGLVHNHASKLGPYIFDGSMLFSSKEYDNVSKFDTF